MPILEALGSEKEYRSEEPEGSCQKSDGVDGGQVSQDNRPQACYDCITAEDCEDVSHGFFTPR